MKQITLYHNADLDGFCSGAIVKIANPDTELYGINYGDEVPWGLIEDKEVFMVDFSMQPWENMAKLDKLATKITWIDHHKTAIDEYEANKVDLTKEWTTVLDTKKAACELCWHHFNDKSMPSAVKLLGRYDVWDLDFDECVLPFQMGMRLDNWNPDSPKAISCWVNLINDSKYWLKFHEYGETVLQYQKQVNEKMMSASFETEFEGLKFLVCNQGFTNSQLFDSKFDPNKHDAVMAIFYKGPEKGWTISLYSPNQKHNLSLIAKKMGGGGHPCACGFQVKDINQVIK